MHQNKNDTPGYVKIKNYILDKIKGGEYTVGSKIPTEMELAKMFSVSRVTANKAIAELSVVGILQRIPGKGSFIRDQSFPVSVPIASAVPPSKLRLVGNVRLYRLLQLRVIQELSPELTEKIGIKKEPFYEIILASRSEEKIQSLKCTYIPCSLIPDITPSLNYLQSHCIFDYLKVYGAIQPASLKIYANVPPYSFLKSAEELLGSPEEDGVWCITIHAADQKLLSTVFTIYPDNVRNIPLIALTL